MHCQTPSLLGIVPLYLRSPVTHSSDLSFSLTIRYTPQVDSLSRRMPLQSFCPRGGRLPYMVIQRLFRRLCQAQVHYGALQTHTACPTTTLFQHLSQGVHTWTGMCSTPTSSSLLQPRRDITLFLRIPVLGHLSWEEDSYIHGSGILSWEWVRVKRHAHISLAAGMDSPLPFSGHGLCLAGMHSQALSGMRPMSGGWFMPLAVITLWGQDLQWSAW